MIQSNEDFSPALSEELFTQFLSAPQCETTSEIIPTQREISQKLDRLNPYPAFMVPNIECVLLKPNSEV